MSHEAAARPPYNTHKSGSSAVPEAPPLPIATKSLQRARDVAYRFMGYQARNADPVDILHQERFTQTALRNRFASLSANQNATASHKTGLEINTLAINEKGTHALIAGKEIFKTVKVEEGHCAEELNLRSAIRSTPTHASGKPRQVYSIDVADVAWGRGDCSDYVAAATSSGKIILYDLGHAGLQAAQLHDHYRQVHRVTFNPHRGNLLLSGSQDGTVRLWDIRDVRNQASTLQSKRKYSGQNDGVRDVKWSPTEGFDFAFGTDSGWIQRWDMRNLKAAKVKIPAHSLACNTIDWHQDGKHILSAGLDKMIRFWDFTNTRKQASNWEIKTPYPVMNARWRPSCESSVRQDHGARICTQIVTSYDRGHPCIHVWDLRRPHLPFREMIPYASAPTDLAWHSQDLLWTVGREGTFLQTDIHHASKTLSRRNVQAVGTSVHGDLYFSTQRRRQRRATHYYEAPMLEPTSRQSTGLSVSPETSLLSRSWADDSLDNLFLSVQPSHRDDRVLSKGRTNSSMSHTTLKLDDVLMRRYSFRPQQAAVRGLLPRHMKSATFSFTAQQVLTTVSDEHGKADNLPARLRHVMAKNAQVYRLAGVAHVARNWDILDFVLQEYLRRKAEHKMAENLGIDTRLSKQSSRAQIGAFAKRMLADIVKSPQHTPSSMRPISAIAQQLGVVESTSNVPTPLAKPVANGSRELSTAHVPLPDPEVEETLILPPSLTANETLGQQPKTSADKQPLTSGNLQDLHRQGQSVRLDRFDMVHKWSVQSRTPFSLEPANPESVPVRPKLLKHDSDESFAFLGGSSDSRGPSPSESFHSDADTRPQNMVSERPSRAALPTRRAEQLRSDVPPEISDTLGKVDPPAVRLQQHESRTKQPHRPARASAQLRSCTEALQSQLQDDSVDLEEHMPFTLVELSKDLIRRYAGQQADAQSAAHFITILLPLLPPTHALPEDQTADTVSAYAETYSSLNLSNDEIEQLIERHHVHVLSSGLDPLQLESVLSAYHDQLTAHGLNAEAAYLRKMSYPVFPSLYEHVVKNNALHFACASCGQAMSPVSDGYAFRCGRCMLSTGPCPVCLCLRSPLGHSLRLASCLLCGHHGHATCIDDWFATGEGACPSEGCLCDCTYGKWRDTKSRLTEKRRARDEKRHHLRVRSDEWKIGESNAVATLQTMDPLAIMAQGRASA